MIKFTFIHFLLIIILFSCVSSEEDITDSYPVSDTVIAFLGEDIINILLSPDKIIPYKLEARKIQEGEEVTNALGLYPIIEEVELLNSEQQQLLISTLINDNTYDFTIAKKGLIAPEYGFKFIKKDESFILYIDFYRKELMFLYHNEEKKEDFDNALPVIEQLIQDIFSNYGGT